MTKYLMMALSKMYKKLSASNKVFLIKKLFNLKMAESRSVVEHLNEFNTLTSQLKPLRSISSNQGAGSIVQSARGLRCSRDGGE